RTLYDAAELMTIDFLPGAEMRALRTKPIDEQTIVAMYMNNRAAEALVRGRLDDAYWLAREAMRQSPGYRGSYNTLGVVYRRRAPSSRSRSNTAPRGATTTCTPRSSIASPPSATDAEVVRPLPGDRDAGAVRYLRPHERAPLRGLLRRRRLAFSEDGGPVARA